MTLIDANLLLYAANADAPEHEAVSTWLEEVLNGSQRAGIAWESLAAFLRLSTNARVVGRPLSSARAWDLVEDWLDAPATWVPGPTDRHAEVFGGLVKTYRLSGKLVPDAHLAALAIEHGLDIYSTDTDFARFAEVRWVNPLAR